MDDLMLMAIPLMSMMNGNTQHAAYMEIGCVLSYLALNYFNSLPSTPTPPTAASSEFIDTIVHVEPYQTPFWKIDIQTVLLFVICILLIFGITELIAQHNTRPRAQPRAPRSIPLQL